MQEELQLIAFLDLIEKWNKKLNLISYKNRHELEVKHLHDSLSILEVFDFEEGQRILDLGTGGGFPGMPLAIKAPEANFVLMDSTAKKINAVEEIKEELGMTNVELFAGRIEDLAHDKTHREDYGMVVARALAPLPTLLEYAAGFVCVNGIFVAYKSANYDKELEASKKAQKELGLTFEGAVDYELPEDMGSRSLLVFRKKSPIKDKYPRSIGTPKKKPL